MAKSKKTRPAAAPAAPAVDTLKDYALLKHLLRAKNGRTWGLPATGGYGGGCAAGKAAAMAYLKMLSEYPIADGYVGLQHIAIDMLSGRSTKLGSVAGESLRGQAVGFFSQINWALNAFMEQCSVKQSFESLTAEMDKGLARTKADDEADAKAARSRIAREAWVRRKEKATRGRRRLAKRANVGEAAHAH